jgi:hypothetical protein
MEREGQLTVRVAAVDVSPAMALLTKQRNWAPLSLEEVGPVV